MDQWTSMTQSGTHSRRVWKVLTFSLCGTVLSFLPQNSWEGENERSREV